jgi:hypothetical protein
MSDADRKAIHLPAAPRRPGDAVFAAFCLLVALFLLSQLGGQTQWVNGAGLLAQPRFWPALSVGGMALFAVFYLVGSLRDPLRTLRSTAIGEELRLWIRSVEFALWFMVYVFATPIIGYLAATVLFCIALASRVGYGKARTLAMAAALGALIVLLFKTFLQVKIPGGTVYEYLPDAIRNFFIVNL